MKQLITITLLLTSLLAQGQSGDQLAPTVAALCQHIDKLGLSTSGLFHRNTVGDELPQLVEYISKEEKAAYTEVTGRDIVNDAEEGGKASVVLLSELLEGCPAASERFLDQVVSRGDASRSLYQLEEWRIVLEAGVEAAPSLLAQQEETLATQLTSILQESVPVAYDTLQSRRGEDTDLELIAAIATKVPGFMRRYQMEEYEFTSFITWLEERMTNATTDFFMDFALEDEFSPLCQEIEKMETFSVDNDIDLAKLAVDEKTIALIDKEYGKGELSRPVLHNAGKMLVLQSIMTRCEHFKDISFNAGLEQAMESLEPTAEEKVKFQAFASEMCECIGKPTQEEGMECFTKTMEAYGMTEENTSFGTMTEDPELQRMMEAVMTLMPVLQLSCRN